MGRLPDTSALCLRTGLPGSGKTLRTVEEMHSYVQEGRAVFACNFVGLDMPGVLDFPDATQWETLPPGAILYVDEAQHFFPPKGGTEKPSHIANFSTVRHLGIVVVLITQAPSLVHSHIRAVTGVHEHILRVEGKPKSYVFLWQEVQDNPKSATAKKKADYYDFTHDPKWFPFYKSSAEHTIKPRINKRRTQAIVLGLFALGLAVTSLLYPLINAKDNAAEAISGRGGNAPSGPASQSGNSRTYTDEHGFLREDQTLTPLEYVQRRIPRIPEEPWSAPLYDDRPVVSQPRVFCISSKASCRCLTEQGTPYALRENSCRYIARNGEPYNPFRPEQQTASAPPEPASPPVEAGPSPERSL